MPKTIPQSVTLPAPAEKLYEMYLSPKKHAAITGGPVSISSKQGSRFRAFDGMIFGKTLLVVPKYMIVADLARKPLEKGGHRLYPRPDFLARG